MADERDAAVRALEHVRQQAGAWKQEALTQKHTVDSVGAVLGGIPDYGPIVETVTAMAGRLAACEKIVEAAGVMADGAIWMPELGAYCVLDDHVTEVIMAHINYRAAVAAETQTNTEDTQ